MHKSPTATELDRYNPDINQEPVTANNPQTLNSIKALESQQITNKISFINKIQIIFLCGVWKMLTIENDEQRRQVKPHIKPAIVLKRLRYQANESIRIDPLSMIHTNDETGKEIMRTQAQM